MDVTLELAQYTGRALNEVRVGWRFGPAAGSALVSGRLDRASVPIGLVTAGVVRLGSVPGPVPARWTLEVDVAARDHATCHAATNSWDVWIFPDDPPCPVPAGLTLVRELDDTALAALGRGEAVLLCAPPNSVRTDVELGFSSVFWNTAWTRGQPPHTLGLLCDPSHPALSLFPTDGHSDWQWWELVRGATAMVLDELPVELRPIVQPIDTWFRSHRLGLLFEARVAGGRLAVCSMDLDRDLDTRPAARQFRRSLFSYLSSSAFAPRTEIAVEAVRALFRRPSLADRLGVRVEADGEQPGYEAWRVLDGRPDTLWHSPWQPQPKPYPHVLRLMWDEAAMIAGVRLWPREQRKGGGYFTSVEVSADEEGVHVQTERPATTDPSPLEVRFPVPVRTRHLTIRFLRGRGQEPYAAVAEVELLPP